MQIARLIDHTLLKVDATDQQITALCQEAMDLGTYSVCVNPVWVSLASKILQNSGVAVCSVVGFPLGASYDSLMLAETEMALAHGAHEIDMVMNVGLFKSGRIEQVQAQIEDVVRVAHRAQDTTIIKVIVESAVLTEDEKVAAAKIVANSGAEFLKTSTGFVPNDHLVDDVKLFMDTLPAGFKVKAAGGIRDYATAKTLADLGVARIGASSTRKIVAEELVSEKQ